jgi:hypothetical protein
MLYLRCKAQESKSMSITNLIKGIETQYAQKKEEIIRLNKCLDDRWNELEQK